MVKNGGFMDMVNSVGTRIMKNQWINTWFKRILSSGFKILCQIQWRLTKKLYLHHVELVITQQCSLRCKDCASLIPYIDKPITYDTVDIIAQMEKLFACVDSIYWFRILGGEPLLHPDLVKILDKSLSCSKLRTVDIVTNGTIIPNDELIAKMKNPKFTLVISDYGPRSPKIKEIQKKCDAAGVRYNVLDWENNMQWLDMGWIEKRGRSGRELKEQLSNCGLYIRTLLEGKLYYCPRAAFGALLCMPSPMQERVDIMSNKNIDALRKEIFELDQRKTLTACDHCDRGTKQCVNIPAAEQL